MKVGVMASGRGSNFQALIDASQKGLMPNVELEILIVNKKDAYAIKRAEENNIEYKIITSNDKTREEFDQSVLKILKENEIEVVASESYFSDRAPKFIESKTNVRTVKLAQSVGAIEGADSYINLFETNLLILAKAYGVSYD